MGVCVPGPPWPLGMWVVPEEGRPAGGGEGDDGAGEGLGDEGVQDGGPVGRLTLLRVRHLLQHVQRLVRQLRARHPPGGGEVDTSPWVSESEWGRGWVWSSSPSSHPSDPPSFHRGTSSDSNPFTVAPTATPPPPPWRRRRGRRGRSMASTSWGPRGWRVSCFHTSDGAQAPATGGRRDGSCNRMARPTALEYPPSGGIAPLGSWREVKAASHPGCGVAAPTPEDGRWGHKTYLNGG